MALDIGRKIKDLRNEQGLTLRTLGDKTGYSIGFLSQLERGLTTIAVDSLQTIADVLGVELSSFFTEPRGKADYVLRSYNKEVFSRNQNKFVDYPLSTDLTDKIMLPRQVELFPRIEEEVIENYVHEGEEFVYVLEGILSVYLNDVRHDLYPGDSLHIQSSVPHNWQNHTQHVVKIIAVHTPNRFRKV